MESFLNLPADSPVEGKKLTRESNSTYQMQNQKYIVHRQAKESMLQYATLYFHRLETLKPEVREAAELKWGKEHKQVKFVGNILDIKPFEPTVILGTLFKEQKLKPSILNNIMGVLGQKKYTENGEFQHGQFVNQQEEDVAVLEDISGRITLKNSHVFPINEFVSGTILALKGQAVHGGYFEVEDYCFSGVPFRDSPIIPLNGAKRELYDIGLLESKRQFIGFVSGLEFGKPGSTQLQHELLARFLRGEFADANCQKLASQITRLVIAGDSMVQPN